MKISFLIFLFVFFANTNITFATTTPPDSLDYTLYNTILSISDTAAESVALKQAENLLKKGANPNALLTISNQNRKQGTYIPIVKASYRKKYKTYYSRTTCIHAAVATKNFKIMEMLLSHGGNPDILDGDKVLPINLALSQDDIKMVDFLLNHGSKISNLDLQYTSSTTTIETFVKKGAYPKTIDINYALGDTILLKKLFSMGAGPNTHPLDFKKILRTSGLLDFLIKNGFDVNSIGKFPENSPLIFAAIKYAPLDTLKKIIKAGATIFTQANYDKKTPLTTAIKYDKPDIVKFLLDEGCSANELDWSKEPPVYKAITTDNDTLIKLLIDHGADIEYLTFFGKTPLMKAVQSKKFNAVKTLVENGANINASDNYGETPLTIAIQKKDLPVIKYLVKHGAETKITYNGKTLSEFANSEGCSPEIINYLKSLK